MLQFSRLFQKKENLSLCELKRKWKQLKMNIAICRRRRIEDAHLKGFLFFFIIQYISL